MGHRQVLYSKAKKYFNTEYDDPDNVRKHRKAEKVANEESSAGVEESKELTKKAMAKYSKESSLAVDAMEKGRDRSKHEAAKRLSRKIYLNSK